MITLYQTSYKLSPIHLVKRSAPVRFVAVLLLHLQNQCEKDQSNDRELCYTTRLQNVQYCLLEPSRLQRLTDISIQYQVLQLIKMDK